MSTVVTTTNGVLLLVKDSDASSIDPTEDVRGSYKRGDIVEVIDGTAGISLPPAPPFYIIRVTNTSMAQAQKFMQSAPSGTRRDYFVNLDAITPLVLRNEILTDRYIEVTMNQIRNFITNKTTGQTQ